MPYNLLSEPVRRFIRDKRWDSFRPIQAASITKITTTKDNYILASRTASGKTEAAFLPIISQIDQNAQGVQVLYISPLIALINDQFIRIEELCKYLDIKITKWHGDANKTAKEKLIKEPSGILLITPESIEAMFANTPFNIPLLFSNLKFIVVDEIHSFLGTERGVQLKSLIYRIKEKSSSQVRGIGLSATIGDFEEAKSFFGDYTNTKVLRDSAGKDVDLELKYFPCPSDDLSQELISDLYNYTKENKLLIFPNNRGRVEEVAIKLKKMANRKGDHQNYFTHHSSINKELREYAEHFAKNNTRYSFSIVCTSTLELGVDIGTVDLVTQIDSTFSVSSLAQRLGRSGRREGITSHLLLYGTKQWSFLQSLSCIYLLREGFTEPIKEIAYPIDILLHQILSILKETSGLTKKDLLQRLINNTAFKAISHKDFITLIESMIKKELIEDLKNEVILGNKAEALVNNKFFYSVFKTEKDLRVVFNNQEIGEISISPQIIVDQNIYLAARIWKIVDVDFIKYKIEVIPANDGKKPIFNGSGGNIHKKVREKMLETLLNKNVIEDCNEAGKVEISELRKTFTHFQITMTEFQRPLIITVNSVQLYTFTGTRINRTLDFLFQNLLDDIKYNESMSMFELPITINEFYSVIEKVSKLLDSIDTLLEGVLPEKENLYNLPKWAEYLDNDFKQKIILTQYFDVPDTKIFLKNVEFILS